VSLPLRVTNLHLTDTESKTSCSGSVAYSFTVGAGVYQRTQSWERSVPWPPKKNTTPVTRDYSDILDYRRYAVVVGLTDVSGFCFTWRKVFPVSHVPGSDIEIDNAATLNLLWTRVRKAAKELNWNAAVDIAESRKTFEMLTTTARRIADAVRSLKKGRIDKVTKLFGLPKKSPALIRANRDNYRDAANLWLEYKYGWSPLYKSCIDAAEHLASLMLAFRAVRHIRKSVVHPEVRFSDDILLEDGGTWEIRARRTTVVKSVVKAWVTVGKDGSESEAAKLGFEDPHLVFWELVPFSFVVDWFCGIGNWLESMTAFLHCNLLDIGHSVLLSRETDYDVYTVVKGAGTYSFTIENRYRLVNGEYRPVYVSREYRRYRDVDVPMPMPVLKNPLGISHLVTSLALIKQRR